MQEPLQGGGFRPGPPLGCGPMHGSRKSLVARLADAVDLAIDFATLGEYGLEPVEERRHCSERRRVAGPYQRRAPTTGLRSR
jgi:hypothetical protein